MSIVLAKHWEELDIETKSNQH